MHHGLDVCDGVNHMCAFIQFDISPFFLPPIRFCKYQKIIMMALKMESKCLLSMVLFE